MAVAVAFGVFHRDVCSRAQIEPPGAASAAFDRVVRVLTQRLFDALQRVRLRNAEMSDCSFDA